MSAEYFNYLGHRIHFGSDNSIIFLSFLTVPPIYCSSPIAVQLHFLPLPRIIIIKVECGPSARHLHGRLPKIGKPRRPVIYGRAGRANINLRQSIKSNEPTARSCKNSHNREQLTTADK